MNRRFVVCYFIVILLTLVACNNKQNTYIMPEDSLKIILNDLYIVEGISMTQKDLLMDRKNLYDQYFIENNIDRHRFDSSLKYYYMQRPKELSEEIYKSVIDSLTYISNHL